ncbi:unnamed protein product [Paramecium sonneborni]|uniref:Uncharacterized protein n=1 Tax=Paramecium sonneborni TaxID=65129 RepID=A0A8S1PXT3_9CILI|nr:unnamed protein product [Paramecium sonneborni]
MQNFHYQSCNMADHEDEFLNMVCIDEKCNKHQLLCVYCMEEHQQCIKHPVKKFLRDFKSQVVSQNLDTGSKIEDLIVFYDQIKTTMEQAQKEMNEIFERSKQTIIDTKKLISQFSQQETAKSVQMQKLIEFESTLNQDTFIQLLAEIESFKPNSERFSFSIKKIQGHQIGQLQERIANGKFHQREYQSAITGLNEQFVNLHEVLKKNLQNYFLNAPQKPIEQEQNESKIIKQQQSLYPLIQPPTLEIQEKSIIAIDDDLEEIERGNRNNENIKKQTTNNNNNNINNNNNNNINNNNINNNNSNNNPTNNNLINYQNSNQKNQDSQISITDILDSSFSKKQSFSDNKQNQSNNNKQQQNNKTTKQFLPSYQPTQQNSNFQKYQSQTNNGTSQIPTRQPPLPPSPPPPPTQPPLQSPQIDAYQDENQGDVETILNVSQDQSFQLLSNSREITKLLLLSKSVVAGCGGLQFQGFDITTCKKLFTLNLDADITDAAYLETDEFNGTLYLATNKGKIETFIRESNSENQFTFRTNSQQLVDRPGVLLIQINQQEKQLVTLGQDKVIRIFPIKTLRELKRCDIQDVGTALHVDSKYVYVGGNKFLFIWDQTSQTKKIIQISESKVISIQTNENKLIVGLSDKIKIYERKANGDYQPIHEQSFGEISTMNILKKWPILLVSCTSQQQQKVCLYNYEQDSSEKLQEQKATSCAVREFDKIYHVAFGQEKGLCNIYRIEQTQQQQSQ